MAMAGRRCRRSSTRPRRAHILQQPPPQRRGGGATGRATRAAWAPIVATSAAGLLLDFAQASYSNRPCWGAGFSRALCCGEDARVPCFSKEAGGEGLTKEECCDTAYDPCFLAFVHRAPYWNAEGRTCAEFLDSEDLWLSRNCLAWRQGDRGFERAAVTDVLESGLARCFHASVAAPDGAGERRFDFGLCAPRSCGEAEVANRIFVFTDLPRLTLRFVTLKSTVRVTVVELAPWQELGSRADFAIAGFLNSGTSTLTKTLAAHPEVDIALDELDIPQALKKEESGVSWSTDWREWLCTDLLPRRWLDEQLPQRRGGEGSSRQRVRGFKNPLLLYSEGCVQSLARALPKLVVAVRDPTEWVLSVFGHNHTMLGHALHDWALPSAAHDARGAWFGRDHARFGAVLARLLRTWPRDRVLAVELEHLRNPATAPIVLDAVCSFLGVTPLSELPPANSGGDGGLLRYSRGLGASGRTWGSDELCAPDQAPNIQRLATSFAEEYRLLPPILASVGVPTLGVSSTLLLGGAFARHCRQELLLPGARVEVAGRAEQAAVERRIRIAWRGELGFEFRAALPLRIAALGCGAGSGPLRRETRVTLWDAARRTPMWISVVGPASPIANGFAYSEAFPQPLQLTAGATYALTVQAAPGLGLAPAAHAGIEIAPQIGAFLGGVFSRGPWLYPSERDELGWEQAYVSIATVHALD